MNEINMALISYAGYALIGAGVVIALLGRRRKNLRRQVVEPVYHSYRCLSVTLPVGGDAGDDAIEHTAGQRRGLEGD